MPQVSDDETRLETLEPGQALFEGRVQGLVAVLGSHERPPRGLAGLLDWRFQGVISRAIARGFLTGEAGECAYLPVTRAGTTYHLLLVGSGASRAAVPAESLKALKKNLASLKLARMGISRADWGSAADESLAKNLKGTGICILR
jgi:hypothetical protein